MPGPVRKPVELNPAAMKKFCGWGFAEVVHAVGREALRPSEEVTDARSRQRRIRCIAIWRTPEVVPVVRELHERGPSGMRWDCHGELPGSKNPTIESPRSSRDPVVRALIVGRPGEPGDRFGDDVVVSQRRRSTSTPPTQPAVIHIPPQLITYSASIDPPAVSTPVTRRPSWRIPSSGVFSKI